MKSERTKRTRRGDRSGDGRDRQAQEIERLKRENERLREQLTGRAKRIADLERQLGLRQQNSTTTSKPPSSDGLAGQQRERGRRVKSRRKAGGQPGHPGHHRPLMPSDRVDTIVDLVPDACRHCEHRLHARHDVGDPRRHQITELPPIAAHITEYRCHRRQCRACGTTTLAPLPDDLASQFGPQLTALIAYLTVVCRLPRQVVQRLLEGVLQIPMSRGSTQKAWEEASAAVVAPYEELQHALAQQPVLRSHVRRNLLSAQELATSARDRPTAEYTTANPGYFTTLDLPIVSGRGFNDRDTLRSVPVCLVNEAFVRRHFKGRNPIGARLSLTARPNGPTQIREIVGVARQTSGEPDAPEEWLQVYVPLAQFPTGDVYMVVQPSAGKAETLPPLVRRVVARIDPDVPVRRDRTLERLSIASTAGYRFRATMVGTFAALALVLAMVGVFGVLAYTVQQRQREIGVRMALGASSTRVMWLVFREAGWMIGTGAVAGMVLAGFSGRLVATFLFGVDPLDPVTFVTVPVVILVTAIAAAAAPAWRASRMNPAEAFRYDG